MVRFLVGSVKIVGKIVLGVFAIVGAVLAIVAIKEGNKN